MTKKILLLAAVLLFTSAPAALADTQQTVSVGGSVVAKFVTDITFSGDNVTLLYADNTQDVADLAEVSIDLTYQEATAIKENIATGSGDGGNFYNLSGQPVGENPEGLSKGVYMRGGKKYVIE